MSDSHDEQPLSRTKGRYFLAYSPSGDDLVRAERIPADKCPRRYCWWWRSLSFEWDMPISDGCSFLTAPKRREMQYADISCCRCDSSSNIDQYEPREPHLLEDGFAVPRWHSAQNQRPNGEISYDHVLNDDMDFLEGSYRIGGCDECVLIISKRSIDNPVWTSCNWESGTSGLVVQVPEQMRLDAHSVERLLSNILGVASWTRMQGPNSTLLR